MAILTKLISFLMLLPALFGLYKEDANDTEAVYMEKIESIGYENTIETAIPQTEIYNMIVDHFNAPLPEGKTEKKAVVLGYDGCRADALTLVNGPVSGINKLLKDGASLNLAYCGGVNYPDGENTQATSTAPGWCSLLTGVWADKNGVYGNGQPKNMEYKTLMTSLIEEGKMDRASFLTIWDGHFSNEDSTYTPEKAYCEEKGLNVSFTKCDTNVICGMTAIKELSEEDCPDFMIAIFEGPDGAGHSFGFSYDNPCYKAGFELNEKLSFGAITAIESRPTYENEDWLIIITSDHGGFGTGHGGPSIQERMVFIVSNK